MFRKKMGGKAVRTIKMVWQVHPGLSRTQSLPSPINHPFSNLFDDSSLFGMGKGVLLLALSAKWGTRFPFIDSDTFLALDCATTRMLIKKSKLWIRLLIPEFLLTSRFVEGPLSVTTALGRWYMKICNDVSTWRNFTVSTSLTSRKRHSRSGRVHYVRLRLIQIS